MSETPEGSPNPNKTERFGNEGDSDWETKEIEGIDAKRYKEIMEGPGREMRKKKKGKKKEKKGTSSTTNVDDFVDASTKVEVNLIDKEKEGDKKADPPKADLTDKEREIVHKEDPYYGKVPYRGRGNTRSRGRGRGRGSFGGYNRGGRGSMKNVSNRDGNRTYARGRGRGNRNYQGQVKVNTGYTPSPNTNNLAYEPAATDMRKPVSVGYPKYQLSLWLRTLETKSDDLLIEARQGVNITVDLEMLEKEVYEIDTLKSRSKDKFTALEEDQLEKVRKRVMDNLDQANREAKEIHRTRISIRNDPTLNYPSSSGLGQQSLSKNSSNLQPHNYMIAPVPPTRPEQSLIPSLLDCGIDQTKCQIDKSLEKSMKEIVKKQICKILPKDSKRKKRSRDESSESDSSEDSMSELDRRINNRMKKLAKDRGYREGPSKAMNQMQEAMKETNSQVREMRSEMIKKAEIDRIRRQERDFLKDQDQKLEDKIRRAIGK